jgi:hypothetical protein
MINQPPESRFAASLKPSFDSIDPVRMLLHHLETCEALPMGGVKVACTIAGNRLDWNDLMLHFRA